MASLDLFQVKPTDPLAAFERWSALARDRDQHNETTQTVQRAMWSAFAAWCMEHDVEPSRLSAEELDAYLRSREGSAAASTLTPRYAWRLVRLIGLVVEFMAREQGLEPNIAAAELLETNRRLRRANDVRNDPLPELLLDREDRMLVSFLESSVPRPGKAVGIRWQDIRNRTFVALQRGAGITPLEIRTLKVADVHVDPDGRHGAWKVRTPRTGIVSEHDAPVAKWARPLLAAWLRMRDELEIPGHWLFPSTRTGKPMSKTSQFEACAEVLAAAGLTGDSASGGGYKLRNTFAVRQLATGKHSEAEVAAWLGVEPEEMLRYRRVMTGPIDVR